MSDNAISWHPLCLSDAIEPSSSAGARLHGKELVVWRDNADKVHVWEDRCPHRGMRLSFGFVRGDHLACLYHGWQYDAAGQCRFIPAHPNLDVPATIAVPTYRAREWAGIIWASLDENTASEEAIESFDAAPVCSIYIGLPQDRTAAALMEHGLGATSMVKRLENNLCLVKVGEDQLIAALQPVNDDRTAVHFVLCGEAAPERQRQHALAVKALRNRIETGVAANV